jgi:phenylacetate-coenzyme A ligase PaaK-like adenylate-forming protein
VGERIRTAFGVRATNVYAATETAGIASECRLGHLHRYEDLVIAEIVDGDNQPVPEGEYCSCAARRQPPNHCLPPPDRRRSAP